MEKTPILNLIPADKWDARALLFEQMIELSKKEVEPELGLPERIMLMCKIYETMFS